MLERTNHDDKYFEKQDFWIEWKTFNKVKIFLKLAIRDLAIGISTMWYVLSTYFKITELTKIFINKSF